MIATTACIPPEDTAGCGRQFSSVVQTNGQNQLHSTIDLAPHTGRVSNTGGLKGSLLELVKAHCSQADRTGVGTRVQPGCPRWIRRELRLASAIDVALQTSSTRNGVTMHLRSCRTVERQPCRSHKISRGRRTEQCFDDRTSRLTSSCPIRARTPFGLETFRMRLPDGVCASG